MTLRRPQLECWNFSDGTDVNPLSPIARAGLESASAQAVSNTFSYLRRYLHKDRWLGLRNVYRTDTIKRIRADDAAGTLQQKHLAEYIAASAPIHAVDGWSYLGRALQAHLMGDVFSARHLGYYAELRAAMAILATQGIAVLNRQHFVLNSQAGVTKVATNEGTHSFAWQALQWWAGQPASSVVIGQSIRPYQKDLSSWIVNTPGYGSWAPQARDWILQFGLDLRIAAADQTSRNEASYRPNRVLPLERVDTRASAEFAVALWLSLEPTPSGFERLDLHFLRRSFENAFTSVSGHSPASKPSAFGGSVDSLLKANGVVGTGLRDFLTRQSEPKDLALLRDAAIPSTKGGPTHHLHVLSRATLLLVLAASATRRLFRSANVPLEDSAFWWGLLGLDRGLWQQTPEPHDLLDYWADVKIELDELQAWLARGSNTRYELLSDRPSSLARLSQMELVALWRMAA